MKEQNSSCNGSDLKQSFNELIEHPYTAMGLVDREKFHTGLLGYTCKSIPPFLSKLIDNDQLSGYHQLTAIFEQDSIDLIIENGDEQIAVFEMKLKTTVHNSGKKDISQLVAISEKIEKKNKKKNTTTPPFRLVTLFGQKEDLPKGWKNITYKEISKKLDETLAELDKQKISIDKNTKALITLWLGYLKKIVEISDCVLNAGSKSIESIDRKEFEDLLTKIKLKGIFEDYRANMILKDDSISALMKKKDFMVKIDNSHGNGLLDLAFTNRYNHNFGIQWQANKLKLFAVPIEKSEKNSTLRADRDAFLTKLADFYYNNTESLTGKLNKDGHFRSITIEENWSFFDDLEKKAVEILKIMNKLDAFKLQN